MANILQLLGAVGKGVEGYGLDQENRVKSALLKSRETRDAENDRVLNALRTRETELMGAPKPPELAPVTKRDASGRTLTTLAPKVPGLQTEDLAPEPAAPKAPNLITAPDPTDPGKLIRVEDKPGQEVPGPSAGAGMGGAAIKKALASNTTQLAVIDDALKELDAHPKAVGLVRGLPVIGDRLDPRADPAGVAARAQIANIGSLKIHDRSGAAVSIHEFPRLAPFIPSINDPPDAIRVKLGKLREAILVETEALRQQGGGGAGKSPSDHSTLSDEEFARRWKAGEFRQP